LYQPTKKCKPEKLKAMKAIAVNLDDIIFENRNKEYGAYALRRVYSRNMIKAVSIAVLLFLAAVSAPILARFVNDIVYMKPTIEPGATIETPPDIKPPDLPKNTQPPKQNIPTFVAPVVVVDTNEVKGDMMGDQDKVKNDSPLDTSSIIDIGGGGDVDKPIIDKPKGDDKPLVWVPEMPEFPGGEAARVKYLASNISYPKVAREMGIQGPVYLTFVVNENGKIIDINIARGIGGGCDEEALRVIKNMPDWSPGRQNGVAVKVMLSMAINFRLEAK
jgi:protein TonB